jgi:DNA-binding CsgD family transcriptional regulator
MPSEAVTCRHAPLTPREKECLLWTLRGKSAWETATILGISEHTVVKIVRSATRKLDAPNKQSAAIRAMKLGLLDSRDAAHHGSLSPQSAGDPRCDAASWQPVQLPVGALLQLAFTPVVTDGIERVAQASWGPMAGGYVLRGRTTWQAFCEGAPVFLQWAWTLEDSGIMLLMDPLGVKTNARVQAAESDALHDRPLVLECMCAIHCLDWQETVREAAARASHAT